ncbi:MAG: 50S ribosomal protein L25 [Phycisphaerae bacterium]|nr:50S ribosomal protein L25 [Phycisphaerae bacterium]
MEKSLLLKAEIRKSVGTKSSAALRNCGKIPATIYGHGQDAVSVALSTHGLTEGLRHGHRVVEIDIDGKKETVLFKSIQYDHLGKYIIHADLMRVNVKEKVTVEVAVEAKGTAVGIQQGGLVTEHADKVEVECAVNNIPDSIVVSVKELGVGGSIHAGDVEMPAGVKLVSDPQMLLISCQELKIKAVEEEVVEGEEPQAPEVIGKSKKEEEESAEE